MSTSRAHITFPKDILADLDRLIDKRRRSKFIVDAVVKELLIARQRAAFHSAIGKWKDKDHPELKAGTIAWTKKLRRESEVRFQKQIRQR
jgi:metal-responsive CopG/Arc/MetJ family transcriptional regulator